MTHQTPVELVCDTRRQMHHSNSENEFSTHTMELTDAIIIQAQWRHEQRFLYKCIRIFNLTATSITAFSLQLRLGQKQDLLILFGSISQKIKEWKS